MIVFIRLATLDVSARLPGFAPGGQLSEIVGADGLELGLAAAVRISATANEVELPFIFQ